MPGPVSDAFDPVWGTSENAFVVKSGINEMNGILSAFLDQSPPEYILDVIKQPDGNFINCKFSERQLRILRYVCRVALDEEDI